MYSNRVSDLRDDTPLPELTLYDLLEPSTSKEQNATEYDGDDDDDNIYEDDDDDGEKTFANAVLNTPVPKKAPTVRILENKRITAPASMGPALRTMLGGPVRVVTTPTKTEVKILNQQPTKTVKAFTNATPVKIGSTTIATPSTGTITVAGQPKYLSGITQIKTADGQVLLIQKSETTSKAGVTMTTLSSTRLLSQVTPSNSGIRQAIISKGLTLSGAGQIKPTPITVRGLTTVTTAKPAAETIKATAATLAPGLVKSSPTAEAATKMAIQLVRTTDGKLIKLNQGSGPVLLNTKPATVAVRAAVSNLPTATAAASNSSKLINKTPAQVIIKGPIKPLLAGSAVKPVINNASTSSSSLTTTTTTSSSSSNISATAAATAPTTTATMPTGKMLVQSSTGKQIVVASKNIIKLSPKPGASANTNATPSGVHSIQLPGKTGVQYVRVLPNNEATATTSRSISNTVAVSNTNKIVMKTMGGSIVPLPSVHTLVARPGSVYTHPKKHRLSDMNVKIKHLSIDGDSGPDAKKARYVIAMPNTSTATGASTSKATTPTTQKQMLMGARPSAQVQRVSVQGTGSSSSNSNKTYNLVTKCDSHGVKYMICNKGGEDKPRATVFNTTMRRGYTLADTKLRRPITLTPQQLRFKQMKLQQQRQVMQQQLQKQQPQLQKPQQQQSPKAKKVSIAQSPSAQANKLAVPTKPLFDILKPEPEPTPAAPATVDALGGSRRKHCNCSKSQCLKLYCDCFANGEFCQDCTCKDCFNNLDYEVKRERAIRSCLERNPSAFKPKITAPNSGDMRLHNKGCNCKRSGCLKNYCECYEAKIPCSGMCKCVGCRNMEDRPDVDMDSMDSLADLKLHANRRRELSGLNSQGNRSNVYLTDDVIEATIMCMISRIVLHEKQNLLLEDTEREVMEELGESLNQIITFGKGKNDTVPVDDDKTTA